MGMRAIVVGLLALGCGSEAAAPPTIDAARSDVAELGAQDGARSDASADGSAAPPDASADGWTDAAVDRTVDAIVDAQAPDALAPDAAAACISMALPAYQRTGCTVGVAHSANGCCQACIGQNCFVNCQQYSTSTTWCCLPLGQICTIDSDCCGATQGTFGSCRMDSWQRFTTCH